MNLTERINRGDPRHLPTNVVRMEERERRPAQKWWERAQAGQLVTKDLTERAA